MRGKDLEVAVGAALRRQHSTTGQTSAPRLAPHQVLSQMRLLGIPDDVAIEALGAFGAERIGQDLSPEVSRLIPKAEASGGELRVKVPVKVGGKEVAVEMPASQAFQLFKADRTGSRGYLLETEGGKTSVQEWAEFLSRHATDAQTTSRPKPKPAEIERQFIAPPSGREAYPSSSAPAAAVRESRAVEDDGEQHGGEIEQVFARLGGKIAREDIARLLPAMRKVAPDLSLDPIAARILLESQRGGGL